MRWLAGGSAASVAAALAEVAPQLSRYPIAVREPAGSDEPLWHAATAALGEQYIAKFAWSRPAALRIAHEIAVLTALSVSGGPPALPEIVAASTDPVLLVTRRVPGSSLFQAVDAIDRDDAGRQLARFLAALHHETSRARVEAAIGALAEAGRGPQHPAPGAVLQDRLEPWLRPEHLPRVRRWCDWADGVLAAERPTVLVHADLHGDNQIWHHGALVLVIDFETACAAEPEYDLRALPGTGPGVELLTATLRHYHRITGRSLAVDRVMAWHLRTALNDMAWRSEAGLPLPDHRTAAEWTGDLSARLSALGVGPAT